MADRRDGEDARAVRDRKVNMGVAKTSRPMWQQIAITNNVNDIGCWVAGATGLEPAASGVTGRRSNQLSYAPFRE